MRQAVVKEICMRIYARKPTRSPGITIQSQP